MVSMDLNPKIKHVIHYMQPHAPYIYYNSKGYHTTAHVRNKAKQSFTSDFISKVFKQETIWAYAPRLPESGMGHLWKQVGREGIIKGYTKDLELALFCIKILMKKYPKKKFAITADHGERLGENGNYGHHHTGEYDKEIVEVPWWTNE